MRIAQVSPLHERVPPHRYGGTERIVSFLTEELVALGHEVVLFASADSQTSAKLVPGSTSALRTATWCRDPLALHFAMLEDVARCAEEFDVIHSHLDYLGLPVLTRAGAPFLTTAHGRMDYPEYATVYREFAGAPFVSISLSQRSPVPWMNWVGNVHHGLPPDLFSLSTAPRGYLAFLGRVAPEKGLHVAITLALQLGIPLKIGAKVDRADLAYFNEVIKPMLGNPGIEFLGEIGDDEKQILLGGALGLLFPIDWPEPFGIVMIEAMACGTPVLAWRHGSVSEVVDDGVTGFVVDSIAEAAEAVERLGTLRPEDIRATFEQRFTARRMAEQYATLYERRTRRQRLALAAAN